MQYEFIVDSLQDWNFPKLISSESRPGFFRYDMEYVQSSLTVFDYLSNTNLDDEAIDHLTLAIFNFVEKNYQLNNKKNLATQNLSCNFQKMWDQKVIENITKLESLAPEFFVFDSFMINGKEKLNLRILSQELSKKLENLVSYEEVTEIHGDLTLSNMLFNTVEQQIHSIDPNPDQIYKSIVVDHGKVLQSLWGSYEGLIDGNGVIVTHTTNEIRYTSAVSIHVLKAYDRYMKLLGTDVNKVRCSEILCFVAFVRLLPYRIALDRSSAALFFAKAMEIGEYLLNQNWNIHGKHRKQVNS